MPIASQRAVTSSNATPHGVDTGWWRHLFLQSSDPQFICDRDGLVRDVNPAAGELLVLSRNVSILDTELFGSSTKQQIRTVLARDLSGTEIVSAVGIRAANGTCLVADLRLTPFDQSCWLVGINLAAQQPWKHNAAKPNVSASDPHDTALIGSGFAHSILNSLEGSLYLLDGRFHLIAFSDGWLKMPPEHGWLKFTKAPEAGSSLLNYVCDPHRRSELEKSFSAVLAEGQQQQLQAVDALGRHWLMDVLPWRHEGEFVG
jgi:hypothetical protein